MANQKRHIVTHLMLERLVGIHKRIKSGTFPNTKQLANEFNEGKGIATISRDIEFLRDRFGAPIVYDSARKGYYYTEDFDMPLNSISPEKLEPLFAAKMMLSHFKNTPMYKDASKVIDFLADSMPQMTSDILKRIALSPSPQIVVEERVWNIIMSALQSNTVIEFDYNGRWNTKTTHRKVHPYQLILDDGKYFLYGYSEERKATRLFSLSRIKNPTETEEQFILPPDFDFESQCGGGKFGSFTSAQEDHYKIEFYESARQMVKECVWADDQVLYDDDSRNCTTIEFTSTQSFAIEEWILAQGCNAKPVEPEWLVEDWKDHIREMMKLAEK